ncbi:cobalamin-binding protein [Arenicella sp. 4NH20-0111]|uniref:cobalamin-binding protein n=1 Tax=Arenicella sp. 4NH20-0111 TaxID=3127648 RepID=UPI00310A837E
MPNFHAHLRGSVPQWGAVWLTLFCGLLLTSCDDNSGSQKADIPNPTTDFQKISVTDFSGKKVTLDKPATRIVALAPHIVENLYTIGAGDQIVGVVSHSDYPANAVKHPIVGGYQQTNHERIVELNPDLIVAWDSGNSQDNISKLRELGFTILIDQPDSLNDIAKSLRLLGAVTGNENQADRAAQQFLNAIDKHRIANAEKPKVTTFYQVWNDPLISINGNHIISDAIRTCGGTNVFMEEVAVAPRVSIESIIALNPEAIIASGMGEERPEWLEDWKRWPSLTAVKENNLFFVNPDHLQRHTIRQLQAINTICQQLDTARAKR